MMLFKKRYKYIFGVIPLVLLFRYDLILYAEKNDDAVSEIFLSHLFGGSYDMEKIKISLSILGLLGIVYFSLLFVDYIVQDVFVNAEYIFSRYTNRRRRHSGFLRKDPAARRCRCCGPYAWPGQTGHR